MNKLKNVKSAKSIFLILGLILLLVYSVSFLIPLFWALLVSFRQEIRFTMNPFGWPEELYWGNFSYAWKNMIVRVPSLGDIKIVEMFYNSICYTIVCTIMHTITPCIAAYAVAKYNFRLGKLMYTIVIVTMILPTIGNLASEIQVAKFVGAYNSVLGVGIMKGHFLGTNFLIFYAAFKSLPNDYKEAAEIDGASQFRILTSIVLPLVSTTIGAIALLSFIGYWNDYTTAMIYLPERPTIAYGLYRFTTGSTNESNYVTRRMAACMLVTIPIFVVFLIFKNKLIGNMAVGGIKG